MNKKLHIIFLFFILLYIPGCYALEIEEYSIVAGIGIDYINNEFEVTYEIYEENNGQTTNLSSKTKSGKGNTISIATDSITSLMNKKPYLNHAAVIIINEDVLKNKFDETINYLLHDVRIRSACYFMVSKSQNAKEVFEKSQEQNKVIAFDIYKHFDIKEGQIQKWSNAKFNQVINEKLNKNGTAIIPTVTYEKDCDINGVYLIKSDNENMLVNSDEIFVFQIFNNTITEGLFNVRNMESYYINKINTKLKYKDNQIKLFIDLKILSYDEITIEQKEQYLKKISNQLNSYIENIYNKYKSVNFDPFRIYNLLNDYYPSIYDENKDDYFDFLNNLKLYININIDLLSLGLSEERI